MASKAVQMVCLTLGVIGLIGVITCCSLPRWRRTTFKGANAVTAQVIYEGLWMNCVSQSTGQMQCRAYDSLLALPFQFQAVRAMTVISCILCGLSLLILLFGSDLTRCFKNQGTKAEIILVAAVGLLLAGLLVIIPVSWSAHTTIRDFYSPVFLKFHRREMGVCIYIGWAAGVLLILTGVLLCCFSRPRSSSSSRTVKYRRASGLNDDLI
ncbi:claudin-4-like isoform X1 [Gambusia affinis]|uniref:claudin-4-like isoform X1 n=1 Tax=Gambusia affinis TaxID=33528 RepID=UPI001CDD1257|nr:claudin-4-like isoform X1 [Gambusia affinis]XP_043955996.1 claudin-4-like isoform X1 [Gambusia affinis]XP_043955997.1 claudin-4-like isoform X1 [Gambusia affinis]XP_043955998.1 claudin-4-like isoform X1 [Gambusia affinis]